MHIYHLGTTHTGRHIRRMTRSLSTQSTHRSARIIAMICVVFVNACTQQSTSNNDLDEVDQTFVRPTIPSLVIARSMEESARAALFVQREGESNNISAQPRRRVDLSALPLLQFSPAGQAFRELTVPRALAVGIPQQGCPSLTSASGATAEEAVTNALTSCFAELGETRSETCGCRILVSNFLLRASQTEFAYAQLQLVRVFSAGRLDPLRYFAREALSPEGPVAVISDGAQPIWRIVFTEPDQARVEPLAGDDPTPLIGTWKPQGLDRGRILGVVDTRDASGVRLRFVFSQ